MVNDQEPRYRLVDSNGNVVGSLFQNADGNVEIQDETGTGSVFGPNGITTPAIDAGSVSTESFASGLESTATTDQDPSYDTWVQNQNENDIRLTATLGGPDTGDVFARTRLIVRDVQSVDSASVSDEYVATISTIDGREPRLTLNATVPPGQYWYLEDLSENEATFNQSRMREVKND